MDIMLKTRCGCRKVVRIENSAPRYCIPLMGKMECKAYSPDEEVPRWWYDHTAPMPKDMFTQRTFVCTGNVDRDTGMLLYEEEVE